MPYRLGYACLNTELRSRKPTVFCSRTCRLSTIPVKGISYVKELGMLNLADLRTMIEWNVNHDIFFMRISSDLFPFASHHEHGYNLEFADKELFELGKYAKSVNHRLTMHPGQYNQLGSLRENVVDNTIRDLTSHAEILDRMGLGEESVLVIHMGGQNNDKNATISRWERNFSRMSLNVQKRIVLENDEISFNVREILPTCEKLSIPLVFDWHHHDLNPGLENVDFSHVDGKNLPTRLLLDKIRSTWTRRGVKQKMHYSESQPGTVTLIQRRSHSYDVTSKPPDVDDICRGNLNEEVDLMIEAKNKEQCVFQMRAL